MPHTSKRRGSRGGLWGRSQKQEVKVSVPGLGVGVILHRSKVRGNPPPSHYTILIHGQEHYLTRSQFEVLK